MDNDKREPREKNENNIKIASMLRKYFCCTGNGVLLLREL